MPNRNGQDDDYRYGYQGSESDDEVHGTKGTSYTTHFRQLDTRIGRWLSTDPMEASLSWQSSYVSMDNNPILYNDLLGDIIEWSTDEKSQEQKSKVDNLRKQSKAFNKIYTALEVSEEVIYIAVDPVLVKESSNPGANAMFRANPNKGGRHEILFKSEEFVRASTVGEEFFHAFQVLMNYGTNTRTKGQIESEANLMQAVIVSETGEQMPLQPGAFDELMSEKFFDALGKNNYTVTAGSEIEKLYFDFLELTELLTDPNDEAYGGKQKQLLPTAYNKITKDLGLKNLEVPNYGFTIISSPVEEKKSAIPNDECGTNGNIAP